MMRWLDHLRSFKALGIIGLAAVTLGVVENRQQTYHHLRPRSHSRTSPQLEAPALAQAARVLLERYPDKALPNRMMGTALAELGNLAEARHYLERAMVVEDGRDQQLLFLYARLLVDLKEDPEQVRQVVEQIGRYFPRSRADVEAYFREATGGVLRFDRQQY